MVKNNSMQFNEWKNYFLQNKTHFSHVNFEEADELTSEEKKLISSSLQQFQRGEHSEGKHLYAFAKKFPDPDYLASIKPFIQEEQMHARVLGSFMKKHGIPAIRGHWVDSVFRWLRKLAGIENTVRVLLVAEIISSVYYKALHEATGSQLLKKICSQILYDEDYHIRFQCDALQFFYKRKPFLSRLFIRSWQLILMAGTIVVVWWHHRKVLKKGGYSFKRFFSENLRVFFAAESHIKGREPVKKAIAA
jgi:hypothetical protein